MSQSQLFQKTIKKTEESVPDPEDLPIAKEEHVPSIEIIDTIDIELKDPS